MPLVIQVDNSILTVLCLTTPNTPGCLIVPYNFIIRNITAKICVDIFSDGSMSVAAVGHKRSFANRRIPDRQVSSLGSSRDCYREIYFLEFLLQLSVRLKKKNAGVHKFTWQLHYVRAVRRKREN